MTARILDGVAVADAIRAEVRPRVDAFTARAGRPPGLGIVLVGDDPASEIYVRSKLKSAGESGLARRPRAAAGDGVARRSARARRPAESRATCTTASSCSRRCRRRWAPTPSGRSSTRSRPTRTSTAFIPINVGRLVQNRRDARGVHAVRRHRAARALAVFRSPAAAPSSSAAATSSASRWRCCCCIGTRRSRSAIRGRPDLPAVAREADILVAAIGRPAFVTQRVRQAGRDGDRRRHDRASRTGALVERLFPAGAKRRDRLRAARFALVGDVHPDVAEVAGALTPVPGGVGPLTIAMLLKNTVLAAEQRGGRGCRTPETGGRPGVQLDKSSHEAWSLTGGIATGKSYVLDRFRARGVPCLDADELAHGVTAAGTEATAGHRRALRPGRRSMPTARSIGASWGRSCSPTRPRGRDLEAIVHPAVYRAIAAGLARVRTDRRPAHRGRRHSAAVSKPAPAARLRLA